MQITYDEVKNQANIAKHGVDMALANSLEWENSFIQSDVRFEYGEQRYTALGYIGNRLHVAIFVDRGDARRIISLRKANKREETKYASS